jgi:hypothetical protein
MSQFKDKQSGEIVTATQAESSCLFGGLHILKGMWMITDQYGASKKFAPYDDHFKELYEPYEEPATDKPVAAKADKSSKTDKPVAAKAESAE